jgi:multidrug resistance efflux pump
VPVPFSRSVRALAADRFRPNALVFLLGAALLLAWGAWFTLARVTVYAVSEKARVEVERAVHRVEAPVAGRVVATSLALDRDVEAGEVLLELDATAERLSLGEARARRESAIRL